MSSLLVAYLVLRLAQQAAETALAVANRRHAVDPERLAAAGRALEIPGSEMQKAVAYSAERHRFALVAGWTDVLVALAFLAAGGLGLFEGWAAAFSARAGGGSIATGLAFFALLGAASSFVGLPFDLYSTFVIEQRHGFNRQTLGGFFSDRLKAAGVALALGAPLLSGLLWVMARMGASWWLWAWALVVGFNLLAAWIYPSVLAPLFNRFTPLPAGELREGILELARRTGFRAGGVFVMDASRRTAHGNAYFTGLFGQRRIVLFDTLVEALGAREVIAVLAHELGHFKLHHVRWAIARSVAASGVLFFLLGQALPLASFYAAFSLRASAHGALVVFGLWFSLAGFLLQPLENALSRRHEFAADAFAVENGASPAELGAALRRLREKSRQLPVVHPLYSRVYHSHPPLLERLRALGALALLLALGFAGPAAGAEAVNGYRARIALCAAPRGGQQLVVLRGFVQGGASLLLAVDPQSLATRILPSAGLAPRELSWAKLRESIRATPYGRALDEAERTAGREQDAGIVHVLPPGNGVVLTIDLCPAPQPLDRGLFSSVLASFSAAEHPVPMGIAITGLWMREHPKDLAWLRRLETSGEIAVTWINHSFNHRYTRGIPLSRNFLLEPGTDPEREVLATEKAMIENGLRPSVFFRFPGLVSDRALVGRVVGRGLIPIGSDAWLAKNQAPSPGSIVLVHGNGNEPLGIARFLALLRLERKAIRSSDWLLFDLRDVLARQEEGP